MLGKVTLEMFVTAKRRGDEVPDEEIDALRARAETALTAAAAADANRGYAFARLGDIRAWSGDMPGAVERYREASPRSRGPP